MKIRDELHSMQELISNNDAQIKQQITFWDAGAQAYRWGRERRFTIDSIRLSPLTHVKRQLDAVAQILLVQDATDVTLDRS